MKMLKKLAALHSNILIGCLVGLFMLTDLTVAVRLEIIAAKVSINFTVETDLKAWNLISRTGICPGLGTMIEHFDASLMNTVVACKLSHFHEGEHLIEETMTIYFHQHQVTQNTLTLWKTFLWESFIPRFQNWFIEVTNNTGQVLKMELLDIEHRAVEALFYSGQIRGEFHFDYYLEHMQRQLELFDAFKKTFKELGADKYLIALRWDEYEEAVLVLLDYQRMVEADIEFAGYDRLVYLQKQFNEKWIDSEPVKIEKRFVVKHFTPMEMELGPKHCVPSNEEKISKRVSLEFAIEVSQNNYMDTENEFYYYCLDPWLRSEFGRSTILYKGISEHDFHITAIAYLDPEKPIMEQLTNSSSATKKLRNFMHTLQKGGTRIPVSFKSVTVLQVVVEQSMVQANLLCSDELFY